MSVPLLQDLLIKARGSRKRPEISARADAVAGGVALEVLDIENHEVRMRTPTPHGLKLRTHCAAVGLGLMDAYTALGYWPPLDIGPRQVALAGLHDHCKRWGIRVAGEDLASGRVVIQL